MAALTLPHIAGESEDVFAKRVVADSQTTRDGAADFGTAFHAGAERIAHTLEVDLRAVHEFGGLEIDWARGLHASRYAIETSRDGRQSQTVRTADAGNGGRDSYLMPESEARYIRLRIPDPGRDIGITEIHVRDLEFGASPNAFVRALPQESRRGCYPRPYLDEQSYWTVIGVDADTEESMLSEDGALEVRKGSFSIEPFVRTRSGWLTWADVVLRHSLAERYLPIPGVTWEHRAVELTPLRTAPDGSGRPTRVRSIVCAIRGG